MTDTFVNPSKGDNQVIRLELTAVFPNGKSVDLTDDLKRVRIENSPSSSTMTVFRFILNTFSDNILNIQQNSSRVCFNLKGTYSNLSSGTTSTSSNLFEPIILKPLLMDKNIIPSKDLLGPSNTGKRIRYEFAAVSESALQTNKVTVSGCYRNVTMAEVLVSLLSKTGKRLYIDQPTNSVKYSQVPLLPGNIINNIYHLDNIYGIYNDNLNIYNYYNAIIVAPSRFSSFVGSGSVSVLVSFKGNTNEGGEPSLTKSTMYISGDSTTGVYSKNIIVDQSMVGYKDMVELNQELFGNSITLTGDRIDKAYIDSYKLKTPFINRHGEFTKNLNMIDRFSNDTDKAILEDTIINSAVLVLSLNDVVIDQLDVFRQFKIKFDSEAHKSYEGIYRVESLIQTYNYDIKSGSSFNNLLTLRKFKDLNF